MMLKQRAKTHMEYYDKRIAAVRGARRGSASTPDDSISSTLAYTRPHHHGFQCLGILVPTHETNCQPTHLSAIDTMHNDPTPLLQRA